MKKVVLTKEEMAEIMVENNYPKALMYAHCNFQRRSLEVIREKAKFNLIYHVLRKDLEKLFRAYLYWKIGEELDEEEF